MPKIKTHSGAKKRFTLTKNGKVLRAHAYKSHILNKKTTKRKRNLRKTTVADIRVLAGFHNRFLGGAEQLGFGAIIALSELEDLLPSLARHQRTLYTCQFSMSSVSER